MPTLAEFLVEQSSLSAGNTVADLLANPQPTMPKYQVGLGTVTPVETLTPAGITPAGSISQNVDSSSGTIDTGSVASAGTIDPV